MIKKIDVLLPDISHYNALQHLSKKLFEAFNSGGIVSRLVSFQDYLTFASHEPADLTFAFNVTPITPGHLYPKMFNIPHITCLVDPPSHFFRLPKDKYIILGCDDLYHTEFAKELGFSDVVFCPLAAEKDIQSGVEQERIYDIAVIASSGFYEQYHDSWKKKFPLETIVAMDTAIKMTLEDPDLSFIKAFKQISNMPLSESSLAAVLIELEYYLKAYDKIKLIQSIKNVPIHIFGDTIEEWKKALKNQTNVIFHGAVPYEEGLEVMKKSKILLNTCFKNKHGGHDRLFAGALSGALIVTNENTYMKSYFKDGESIVFYNHSEIELLNDRINMYLANPEKRREVAAKGREITLQNHTWDQRVISLLPQLEAILSGIIV